MNTNDLFQQATDEEIEQARNLVTKFQNIINESNVSLSVAIKALMGGIQSYVDWWDQRARDGIEESGVTGDEAIHAMYDLHIYQYGQIISLLLHRDDPQNALEILARCIEFETARLNSMQAPAPEKEK